MAVGDVVNGLSGDNADLDYQPASGVEAVITMFFTTDTATPVRLYNGTINSGRSIAATTIGHIQPAAKIGLNNTRYMRIDAIGAGKYTGYTGVQTK